MAGAPRALAKEVCEKDDAIARGVTAMVVGSGALLGIFSMLHERRETRRAQNGESKIFGSVLAPPEFYKEEARWVWRVRDIGLKAFAICIGCGALAAVAAAILDIKLG